MRAGRGWRSRLLGAGRRVLRLVPFVIIAGSLQAKRTHLGLSSHT